LFQNSIKPISKDALYEISALEIIKNTTMGRPKKAPEKTTAKKPPENKPARAKKAPGKAKQAKG
jgi:hypothetical protein